MKLKGERAFLHGLVGVAESASILAHDIKNPRSGFELAIKVLSGSLDQDHEAVLKKLMGRLEELELRVRGVLDLEKLLEFQPTQVSLERVAGRVVSSMEQGARESGVSLEVEIEDEARGVEIEADEALLVEALSCLVENGIEAVEDGGRVRLRVCSEGAGARFEIEDDGPGVLESLRETMFRPFTSSKPSGSGLGLPLARNIAGAHGGQLVHSESPDAGTIMSLSLP